MNTIFPNSCHDVDWPIVLCLEENKDVEGLVALSGVNRRAFELLPNAPYFAELFKRLHPQLIKYGLNFQILPHYHPSNCWKLACCTFSKGVFKVNKPFLEMAIPLLCESLKGKKSRVQALLKEICGDFPFDPKSPIDIAWKSWQSCKQKQDERKLERSEIIKALTPFYFEEDMQWIQFWCSSNAEDIMLSEEGRLVGDFCPLQIKVMNPAHIPHYKMIVRANREIYSKANEVFRLAEEYDDLEKERIAYEKELGAVEAELNSLIPGETLGLGLQMHALRLEDEAERLWDAVDAFLTLPFLKQCLGLCLKTFEQQTISEDQKNQIRGLINSLPQELKTGIWLKLYTAFAKEVEEEQWSEHHFHEFLYPLTNIIMDLIKFNLGCIQDAQQAQLRGLQL